MREGELGPHGERLSEPGVARVTRTRRYLTGVRALCALVACCGVIVWAGRVVWEYRDPVRTESRAIQARALRALQSREATERVTAIRELQRLRFADDALAIRPLTAMLGDEDIEVRIASAEALGTFGTVAVENGSDDQAVDAAVRALIRLLKDPHPNVRFTVVNTLGSIACARPGAGVRAPPGPPPPAAAPVAGATAVDMRGAIAALTGALGDPEAKVRGAAVRSLAAAALAVSGSMAEPPRAIRAILEDESAENRRETLIFLVQFQRGLDSWIPSLLRMAEHDADRSVRERCVTGVAVDPVVRAVAFAEIVLALIVGFGEPRFRDVRDAAATLVGRFGSEADEAIPALLGFFTAAIDDEVTKAAATRGRTRPGRPRWLWAGSYLGSGSRAKRSSRP